MAEYIERGKAKEELLSWAVCIQRPQYLRSEDAMCVLDTIPAADVAPVVHGVWAPVNRIDPLSGYRCVKCRHIVGFDLTPYCPNCGAKMDGGDNAEG